MNTLFVIPMTVMFIMFMSVPLAEAHNYRYSHSSVGSHHHGYYGHHRGFHALHGNVHHYHSSSPMMSFSIGFYKQGKHYNCDAFYKGRVYHGNMKHNRCHFKYRGHMKSTTHYRWFRY